MSARVLNYHAGQHAEMVDVIADPPLFGPASSIGGEAGHCQIQVFQLLLHTSPSTDCQRRMMCKILCLPANAYAERFLTAQTGQNKPSALVLPWDNTCLSGSCVLSTLS